jgi:hypothetical protein
MRLLSFALLAASAALVMSSPAAAGSGCSANKDAGSVVYHIFDAADRDQDGLLTRAEYEDAGLQDYGVSFSESDTNADGATSVEEYLELYLRHHPVSPVDESEA